MRFDEYRQFDATGLGELIKSGELSSQQAWELSQGATRQWDQALNMMVEVFPDNPLSGSENQQTSSPFQGVPFVVKDLGIWFSGITTEFGCRLARGTVFDYDAEMAIRLREMGLALVGRTTTPELGLGYQTASLACGITRNPWDLQRSPGGSSGGSAAAVATGCVPIAHASDALGSIRVPAHCCGLLGLKPPRGMAPKGESWGGFGDLSCNHVLTRSVRDSALMLDQLCTPNAVTALPKTKQSYWDAVHAAPPSFNIGYLEVNGRTPKLDSTVSLAMQASTRSLESFGHRVEAVSLNINWDELCEALVTVVAANQASAIKNIAYFVDRDNFSEGLESSAYACLKYDSQLTTFDLHRALGTLHALAYQLQLLCCTYDVLVMPTCTTVAPLIDSAEDGMTSEVSAESHNDFLMTLITKALDFIHLSPLFNISGQPAISIPVKLDQPHLPVSIQCVASLFGTHKLLQIAQQFEDERGAFGFPEIVE